MSVNTFQQTAAQIADAVLPRSKTAAAATLALWCSLFLSGAGAGTLHAADIEVTSAFNPPVISVGQRSVYEITISGTQQAADIALPVVNGLRFSRVPSVSRKVEIINFSQTSSIVYSYAVESLKEGEYTMFPFEIEVDGETLTVPLAKLEVVPQGSEFKDALMLDLQMDKYTFYSGESIPAELKLYLRSDIPVRDVTLPEKSGEGFLQSDLPENPEIREEMREGQRYKVVTWPILLTAYKTGDQTISYALNVKILSTGGSQRRTRSPFDIFSSDPFDDPFFGRARTEARTVFTGDITVPVLPLPGEQPDHFSGGIGIFQLSARASEKSVKAGEPLTYTVELFGMGNFDRITPPALDNQLEGFKVYPPKTDFAADDRLGYRGTKTFSYILIPESEEIEEIPAITLSTFNPEQREYAILTADSVPLEVKAPPPGTVNANGGPRTYAPIITQDQLAAATAPKLLPPQVIAGRWLEDYQPLPRNRQFLYGQLAPLVLFGLVFLARKRQLRFRDDAAFARRITGSKSARAWLAKARTAAGKNDHLAFFDAAQRAIQEVVGQNMHISRRPETLTLMEVEEYLRQKDMAEDRIARVAEIFNAVDLIKFAPSAAGDYDLKEWRNRLTKIISLISHA